MSVSSKVALLTQVMKCFKSKPKTRCEGKKKGDENVLISTAKKEKEKGESVCASLTSTHCDRTVLGCTALPVGPAAEREPQTPTGCPVSAPGRSVSWTEGAEPPGQRNAAAPPGGPPAQILDDTVHRDRHIKREYTFFSAFE